MKKIKRLFLIPISAIIIMSFSQCSSAQFDKKAPVTITDAFYKNWVGGIPGVKGVLITIKAKVPETDIIFDSIYFNNKMVKLKSQLQNDELILTGNFTVSSKTDHIIMHADPKEEFGNKPPNISNKIPFELQDNEAVISYFIKSKKRYYKLSNIKKENTSYYK
jgi:hypothetical protein